jgi:SAM-dependent methyltransferase
MTLSYSNLLGRRASLRLQRFLIPGLVWNQERYANLLLASLDAKPGSRWLEAGCGRRVLPDGLIALEEAAIAKAGVVVGVDADPHGLASHRSVHKLVSASLQQIPFPDVSFDLVGCNMVAEHLSDPRACLSEMARVLSPGGVLLIHTPNLHNYMVFLKHTVGRFLPRRWLLGLIRASEGRAGDDVFPTLYRMNSAGKLQQLGRDLGLHAEVLEFLPSPRPFFGFFAPLAFFQIVLTRILNVGPLQRFQPTILVALRKPVAGAGGVGGGKLSDETLDVAGKRV